MVAAALVLVAVALQSVGKVLYGTFLDGVATPLFVVVAMSLTAAFFLVVAHFRLPSEGRSLLALANVWTALSFISVFYALKYLPPAMFACIEIGTSLLMAIALTSVQSGALPQGLRIFACIGIVAGCALLSWTETAVIENEHTPSLIWIAILASTVTGVCSALSASTFRRLALAGLTPASILAHRFYLTILAAVVWLAFDPPAIRTSLDGATMTSIAAIGAVAVLVPVLMLQLALKRADELTVMICMAVQPILSFLFAIPSPAYDWNTLTLIGVLVVTASVGFDVLAQHKPRTPAADRQLARA